MSCQLDVATELKQDILACNAAARRQIGDFLMALQENPLPADRHKLGRAKDDFAFYVQLPCGFYVSWEIIGDLMHLVLTGETRGLLVRILGVARVRPE
jgi:hypothetical protein